MVCGQPKLSYLPFFFPMRFLFQSTDCDLLHNLSATARLWAFRLMESFCNLYGVSERFLNSMD